MEFNDKQLNKPLLEEILTKDMEVKKSYSE